MQIFDKLKQSQQKNLSGTEGRKRWKVNAKECAKSSKIMLKVLKSGRDSQSSTSKSVENDTTAGPKQEDIEEEYCNEIVSKQLDLYQA